MFRLAMMALLLLLAPNSAAKSQSDRPPARIVKAVETALDLPAGARYWTHDLLTGVETTALGCELLTGVPLPAAIDAHRLRSQDQAFEIVAHVSADGDLVQICGENAAGVLHFDFAGFRDRDGDGLADRDDNCPTIAGVEMGCPRIQDHDSDGDGLADDIDFCPSQAGSMALYGCAVLTDSDGDGVPDGDDICPRQPGLIRDDFALGCPADGSGASTRQRSAEDICFAESSGASLRESPSLDSPVIDIADGSKRPAIVGRDKRGAWLRLESGWALSGDINLRGACYNIPPLDLAAGDATGCFLAARETRVNVRQAPFGKVATQIKPGEVYATLGANAAGDWYFFRRGWISASVIELSGACDSLPRLDPAHVSSGSHAYCAAGYPGALPPRIDVGDGNARVASYSLANRLREAPSLSAPQIGELPPRQELDAVLDGPACDGPFVWWQVRANGAVGWTVESDLNANVYYLEPIAKANAPAGKSAALPRAPSQTSANATLELISSANLARLDTIAILPIDKPLAIAWSHDPPRLLILNADGTLHLHNYPFFDLIWSGGALDESRLPKRMAFSGAAGALALDDGAGQIHLRNLDADTAGAAATLDYAGASNAMAWSSDGLHLAAALSLPESKLAGHQGRLLLWQFDAPRDFASARLKWRFDFPYPLTGLAFSRDNQFLAVSGMDSQNARAALWALALADGEAAFAKSVIATDGSSLLQSMPSDAPGDFVYSSGDSLYLLDALAGRTMRFYHSPGRAARRLATRELVVPGAEVLLAIADDDAKLTLVNALNPQSPGVSLDAAVADIAFSPDGRALALAQTASDRVLILGTVDASR